MKNEIEHYGDIRDKVKTYEDACTIMNEIPIDCSSDDKIVFPNGATANITADQIAYMKLSTIADALKSEMKEKFPVFNIDEYRYYPYFFLYTKEEIEKMTEEEKKQLVCWGGNANCGAYAGLAYADSGNAWSGASSAVGSRLAMPNKELAIYFGRQFAEIWKDFIFPN